MFLVCWLALATGCVRAARSDAGHPKLDVEEVAHVLPQKVADRDGWARDLLAALDANGLNPDAEHVCAVVAVVDQESGFQANPAVPNLAAIARKEMKAKAAKLGPLAEPVLENVLAAQAPGSKKTFDQRLSAVRTEADLDLLYRDMLTEQRRRHPVAYAVGDLGARIFDARDFDDRNPITTAGSMQVSVHFAEERARSLRRNPDDVRDELYTRQGGLLYGSARLLGYQTRDGQMLYRFADYNAGFYASRNAAFQEQVAALSGNKLALDGDLLAYEASGQLKSADTETMKALLEVTRTLALTDVQVTHDAKQEKTLDFERTKTWRAVKTAYEAKTKKKPAYERLPDVTLSSPKLSRDLSTAWFARAVEKRYLACLARAPVVED